MTSADSAAHPQFVTIGETLVSLSSTVSQPLRYARSLDVSIGGAESNVAIGMTRLGVPTAWVGRVGADEFGLLVQRQLRAEGIDVRAIVDPIRPTALMIKARRFAQRVQVSYFRSDSAGTGLSPDDIDENLVGNATILHLTGITAALSESARDAVHFAADIARSADVLISVDLNYRRVLWDEARARAEYRRLAKHADILLATADEARIAVGPGNPDDQASRLAELGPRQVIIKLGALGAVGLRDGSLFVAEPVPAIAVDEIGAGDAFAAGYLSCLLSGGDLADCMRLGSRLGAAAVAAHGDWEGSPTLDELHAEDDSSESIVR